MTAPDRDATAEPDRTAALTERLFRDTVATLELCTVYLGERLGLYRALADAGLATSAELAERTGTAARYVREWLEQQAASGLIDVEDTRAEPQARRYCLPAEHAAVLAVLRRYAAEAGFANVRVLPIDTDYWRFYQLVQPVN